MEEKIDYLQQKKALVQLASKKIIINYILIKKIYFFILKLESCFL